MSYRMDNLGNIVKDYLTEEGGPGVLVIPLPVLASRMALLGLDDPGAALDAVAAELNLPPGEEVALGNVVQATEEVVYAEAPAPAPRMRMMGVMSEPEPAEELPVPTTPEELTAHPVVARAQARCLADLPMSLGPDGAGDAMFKDSVRRDMGLKLEGLRREYLKQLIPRARY